MEASNDARKPAEIRMAKGLVRCQACTHEWVQQYEIPVTGLLCPNCAFCRGFPKGFFAGGKDDAVYQCDCTWAHFQVFERPNKSRYLLCTGCGRVVIPARLGL